jgi:hypothetical protein
MKGKPRDGSKNPGGRPKEYTPEVIESLAEDLIQWATQDDAMFLASFCKTHSLYRQRLTEFAKGNPKFADALKVAQTTCEANIAVATADGAIPPAFGIFGLKQHAWTDKHEITGAEGAPIPLAVTITLVKPNGPAAPNQG